MSYLLTCTEDERLNNSKCDSSLNRVCRGLSAISAVSGSALSATYAVLPRGVAEGGEVFGALYKRET